MNEPLEIYVVTRGSYSDYRIHSMWSTREAAEETARFFEASYDGGQVEVFKLDQGCGDKWGASVTIDAEGQLLGSSEVLLEAGYMHTPYRTRHAKTITAVGETVAQALKSARDHLAKLKYQAAEEAREAEAKAEAQVAYETMTMGDLVSLVKQGTSK